MARTCRTLVGPAGEIVSDRQFWSSDSLDGISLLNLPAGDYVIIVDATAFETSVTERLP